MQAYTCLYIHTHSHVVYAACDSNLPVVVSNSACCSRVACNIGVLLYILFSVNFFVIIFVLRVFCPLRFSVRDNICVDFVQ